MTYYINVYERDIRGLVYDSEEQSDFAARNVAAFGTKRLYRIRFRLK